MNIKKLLFYYLIISLLTILVLFPDLVFFVKNDVINYAVSGFLIVQVLLLIPVFFFSRFLKVYYWILAILVSFTPIMLFSVFYMNIQVNAEMVGLVLDTNKEEVKELLGWKIILVLLAMFFFGWLFLKLASKLPSKISWKHGLIISLIGVFAFGLLPFIRTRKMKYYTTVIRNTYRTYYPFRLGTTYEMISSQMSNMKNYKKITKSFTFNAKKTDSTDSSRQIYIMVVGEASRYDHWAVNGYQRPTSPEVKKLTNFFTFHDVASGGSMTILSVPQLITRAIPSDYERHTREKSILSAFHEAGYYTAWISNQSHYGLTGNIGMHFNDGDTAMYSGHGENETNFTGTYDETILPMVQGVIDRHPKRDIFLVVHVIGSHWRYVLRYPPSFQKFVPTSDRNHTLITRPSKTQIINEYDNSILYTDYILSRLTDILKQSDGISSFLFVSDHGENLDDNNDGLYFHSYQPTLATAHVPLFLWFNDEYAQKYPEILSNLKANENQRVSSAESVFYTLINVGRLSINGFDSTHNLAGKSFVPSKQIMLGEEGKLYNYKDLH